MNIVAECSSKDSEMESLIDSPSFRLTSETLYGTDTQNSTKDTVISFLVAFPASHLVLLENEPELMTSAICGLQHGIASASLDPVTASLKTFQACLIADISEPLSMTWPKAGIVCGGEFYPQPKWELRINEIGSGLLPTPRNQDGKHGAATEWELQSGRNELHIAVARQAMWPTPRASPNENRQTKPTPAQLAGKHGMNLATAVNIWPTPTTADWRAGSRKQDRSHLRDTARSTAPAEVGGQLNPTFVEWLMEFPLGWTDLKPLAMHRWRQWQLQHGICLAPEFNVYGDRPLPDWCIE